MQPATTEHTVLPTRLAGGHHTQQALS